MINLVRAMTLALVVALGSALAKAQPAMLPTGQATLSVSGSTNSVALPSSGSIVTLYNDGTSQIYWRMGTSSVVATVNDFPLPAGACRDYAVINQSWIAAISGGTSTLRVTRGNGTAAGGSCGGASGGGGGGGGAVTIADGADVAEGATTNSVCATPSSGCSNNSLLRLIAANAAGPLAISQGTPGVTNGVFVTNGLATATGISTLLPNNTTPVVVRNVAATLWYGHITGIAAAPVYVKFYDNASACSGTIRYRLTLPVASTAANAAGDIPALPTGITFSNGITYCATTDITDTNSGAPTASQAILNYGYN